jgi:hypothetical protein
MGLVEHFAYAVVSAETCKEVAGFLTDERQRKSALKAGGSRTRGSPDKLLSETLAGLWEVL